MDPEKFGKDYVRSLKSMCPDREFPRYDKAWLSVYSTGGGCVCVSDAEAQVMGSRGGNRAQGS